MDRGQRRDSWADDTCVVCPAQLLGLGEFDVSDQPGPESRYDPQAGYRVNRVSGAPVCVHPYRVGMPVGRYASDGDPLLELPVHPPAPTTVHLRLPDDVTDLEAWFIATLRVVAPEAMASALRRAEAIATERFPTRDVVAAMRRVLSVELARQH